MENNIKINNEKIIQHEYINNSEYFLLDYFDDLAMQRYTKSLELRSKSSLAFMGQIVTSTLEKPIVGTFALATCYGIIFYDRKNKKAWVGHGPASSPILTLRTMLENINDVTGDLEYGIIPGWDNIHNNNFKEFDKMLNFLCNYCPKQIRLVPIANLIIKEDSRANHSYEFAFNAQTGTSVTDELFYEEDFISHKRL